MLMSVICPEIHLCASHSALLWYGKGEGEFPRLRFWMFQRMIFLPILTFEETESLYPITFLCFFERDPTPKLAYNELPHHFSSGEVIGIFFLRVV